MKSSLVIFLAFLFIGSFANKVKTTDSDPGDSLVEYIQNLAAAVVEEQNEQQTLADTQDAECTKEIAFRTGEVNDANSSLIASDTHLKKCQGALDTANTDLSNLNAQLEVVQGQKSNLESARADAVATFKEREQEHLDAISAVNEAFDILGQFQNSNAAGVSLLAQIGKHITKQVKIAITNKFFMHYAPVIAFLADTPADVTISSDDLQKLSDLFTTLLNNLQSSLATLRAQNDADEQVFETQDALLQSQLDTINTAINNFASYVVTMNACIAEETQISSEASSKLSRNANILTNTQEMCAAFDQEFSDATAARTEKLQNLQLLQELVESKVAAYNAGAYYTPSDSDDDAGKDSASDSD